MTTLANIPENTNAAPIANGNFVAVSPAGIFGVKSNVGLTFGYFGGMIRYNGVLTTIADGTLTLTDNTTNYIEVAADGTVSSNTASFTAGRTPLHLILTAGGVMTPAADYDKRVLLAPIYSRLSKSIAGGAATFTLTEAEARCKVIELTGAITGAVNVVLPNNADPVTIYNGSTGAFNLTIKTASGSGIVIATGKRAIVYADGTNVVRATADV